jgi:hypothetical protein
MRRTAVALLAVVVASTSVGCSRGIAGTPVAAPGAALLATTCGEYSSMSPTARREVIAAIADGGNQLIATNPGLWVGVAAALCTFAVPSARVRDIVTGSIR